jgi:hypothetical protein
MANQAKKSVPVAVIGSRLVDALLAQGLCTRVIVNLDPPVHPGGVPPTHVNPRPEFVHGPGQTMLALGNWPGAD